MYWGAWIAVAISVDILIVGIVCLEITDVLECVGSCGYQC
jgi:hypothetical protein